MVPSMGTRCSGKLHRTGGGLREALEGRIREMTFGCGAFLLRLSFLAGLTDTDTQGHRGTIMVTRAVL